MGFSNFFVLTNVGKSKGSQHRLAISKWRESNRWNERITWKVLLVENTSGWWYGCGKCLESHDQLHQFDQQQSCLFHESSSSCKIGSYLSTTGDYNYIYILGDVHNCKVSHFRFTMCLNIEISMDDGSTFSVQDVGIRTRFLFKTCFAEAMQCQKWLPWKQSTHYAIIEKF